ncbi:hypothetical protein DE146DRAFT_218216 [Phaeosphaeria sp. MPI-PUGE-AT-0046c]|nr:hypothetical protein DE146DRAFT_218216 [Phaeosphaeria sp. MPI-PUGE-AT-0046c]
MGSITLCRTRGRRMQDARPAFVQRQLAFAFRRSRKSQQSATSLGPKIRDASGAFRHRRYSPSDTVGFSNNRQSFERQFNGPALCAVEILWLRHREAFACLRIASPYAATVSLDSADHSIAKQWHHNHHSRAVRLGTAHDSIKRSVSSLSSVVRLPRRPHSLCPYNNTKDSVMYLHGLNNLRSWNTRKTLNPRNAGRNRMVPWADLQR